MTKVSYCKTLFILMLAFLGMTNQDAFCQVPIVKSLATQHAAGGDILTIRGSSFGNDLSSTKVFFGSMMGSVQHVSDELIEAKVPAGAVYSRVSVTRASGMTGYSTDPFMLTFPGEHGFTETSFEGQKDFNAEPGLYDLCLCDLDGDKKNDIMAPGLQTINPALMINQTTSAGIENISFAKIASLSSPLNARTIHVKCDDLNGDGKPDLVLTESDGDRVFFLQNKSSGLGNFDFTTSVVRLTGKKVKRIEIADMDLDGKPDVIITNQIPIEKPDLSNVSTVTVLINQSSLSDILFSNANVIDIEISVDRGLDALVVQDLDGDGKAEIVTSQFQTALSNIYILPNTSTTGQISFGNVRIYELDGNVASMKIGDLDHDGKPDIAATRLTQSSLAIFRNESEAGNLNFASPVLIETHERPFGLDFGDLDGDGKTDIAVASIIIRPPDTKGAITLLNNKSTPGTFSFQRIIKRVTYINRHIAIGDVDGDGKPDVVFASVDDNTNNVLSSKISVLRNTKCILASLKPVGPHVICTGNSKELFTTPSLGITYEWKNSGTTIAGEDKEKLEVEADGVYSVTMTSSVDEGCVHTSDEVTVTVETGSSLTGTASVLPVDPICSGNSVALTVTDVGGTKYKWTGPEGYEAEGLTANPPVVNFQAVNSGRYNVDIYAGDCVAQQTSVVVGILEAPAFHLNTGEEIVVCESGTKTLTVSPQLQSYTYQWYEETLGPLPGQTSTSLNVSQPGVYYAEATTLPSCASGETKSSKISFAEQPIADFEAPSTACISQDVSFTNASTFDTSLEPFFSWNFGDQNQSSDQNPVHAYSSFAEFEVKLTVSYQDGFCPSEVSKTIKVEQAPQVTVTTPSVSFNFCPEGSLVLGVAGTFDTYEWSTGETTTSIEISEPGIYTVRCKTQAGCVASGTQEVANFSEPSVIASAIPEEITEGESAQLSASGLVEYQWLPVEHLSDAFVAQPLASPIETTIYTVTGKDENGCGGLAEVTLRVKGDLATRKIVPSKFFSPGNGDDVNPTWMIEKILAYPHCQVSIYDDKGILVFEAKPYLNTWDGTFHGRQLPDGVYFYMIKCDGEEKSPKTGSITLLR